ncbi:MAG TPA: response regulator, partial [Bacillota bacterium]|nr:response regulator [Bacillota bacterium]
MDKGTEFCVTLRLPVVCSLRKLPTKAPLKTYSFSGKRILICEDNHLNSMIAVKLLEKAGCVVDTAENGQFGIDRFNRSLPGFYSAILMDIRMPELDGLEAARAIRALDRPDAKDVPIIAMSANAFAEDMQKSMDAGMNAHMSKPIDPQKLYELLAQQIGACTVEST